MNYYPTLRTRLYLGIYRSFSDSLFGNYFVDNGGQLGAEHLFRWRMLGWVGMGVAGRTYHGLPEPGVETNEIDAYEGRGAAQLQLRDVLFTLDAKLEQSLGRIFVLGLHYNLAVDSTSFRVTRSNGDVDELGYVQHLLLLLAAVRI
jgi:hypothetical protein